jgi:hypothetical protein
MAKRLGELLVDEQLITQGQLEEALQAQVIFGGKLGTIFIEMGAVSELDMARVLGRQMGVPTITAEQLIDIPENVIATLTPELAEQFQALPVALEQRKLTLAMASPRDLKAIDELSFRTGFIIRPVLAPELRLTFALEKYYKVRRKVRYIAPAPQVNMEIDRFDAAGRHSSPAPVVAAATQSEPLAPLAAATSLAAEEEMDLADMGIDLPAAPPPAITVPVKEEVLDLDELEAIEEIDEELPVAAAAFDLESATRQLVLASDRDDVANALIRYLGTHYARAALFMVVGGQVTGWRSARNGQPIPGFEDFQLPLSEPSVLKAAAESQSYFIGPVSASGANLALLTLLGKPAPTTALFLPLTMLGRVVGLIYLDDPRIAPADALVDAQRLAGKALLTFELLILKSKILRLS